MLKTIYFCFGVTAVLAVSGCKKAPSTVEVNDVPARNQPDIQAHLPPPTNTWFTNVVLWKPEAQSSIDTNALFSLLAPLLIQEVSEEHSHSNRAGIFPTGVDGKLRASSDAVRIGGQHHARIAYRFYVSQTHDPSHEVGIRITLNSDGLPAIWETMDFSKGLKQVYVSRALEEKAAKQFGKPTHAKQFSIEAEDEARVVRVLEDAPVPMGPILYISASGVIKTVICRCMPGQASRVVGTENYKLIDETTPGISGSFGDPPPGLRYPSAW